MCILKQDSLSSPYQTLSVILNWLVLFIIMCSGARSKKIEILFCPFFYAIDSAMSLNGEPVQVWFFVGFSWGFFVWFFF